MKINKLRGTVADHPIDSQVIQGYPQNALQMEKLNQMSPQIEHLDVSRIPYYERG